MDSAKVWQAILVVAILAAATTVVLWWWRQRQEENNNKDDDGSQPYSPESCIPRANEPYLNSEGSLLVFVTNMMNAPIQWKWLGP